MQIRFTFYILVIGIILFSCSEEITPTPFTFSKNFTGENNKTWKIKFYEYAVDGEVAETFNVSCSADDQFIFYSNSERALEIETGSRRCNEGEPAVIANAWSYASATATLTMMIPAFSIEFSFPFFIREIDENDMELEIFLDLENTESYRIHFEAIDEE